MKKQARRIRHALLAAGFFVFSVAAWANENPNRFLITPFGGYRFSGSLKLNDPSYSKLDFKDSGVYGLALGMRVPAGEVDGDASLELMWTHQNTVITAVPDPGSPPASLDVRVDQLHINGLYAPPGFEGVRPYAIAGLGATNFSPKGAESSLTRFSWALGGGAKVDLTDHLGLRLEAKWDPVLQLTSSSVFCNSATGRCFAAASGDFVSQIDFTAGLTLGF